MNSKTDEHQLLYRSVVERWTCDREVAGENLTHMLCRVYCLSNTLIHVYLSPSSIICYLPVLCSGR